MAKKPAKAAAKKLSALDAAAKVLGQKKKCNAIKANKSEVPTKFVLMNTAGNSNRDVHEPISFGQRCVIPCAQLSSAQIRCVGAGNPTFVRNNLQIFRKSSVRV